MPGLTVDLPHHRPSGHRRRTKFRVLGGRPRGGAITAETARFPTQQAINDARVAALGTVRARNQGRPSQARRVEGLNPSAKTRADGSKQVPKTGVKQSENYNDE